MLILNEYIINERTVCFTGEYDEFGQLCTMVIEGENKFLVKLSPIEVMNQTLLQLGSDFRGARESSKEVLGKMKMYPIKINAELGIWLFPSKSFKDPSCVWFSLMHVERTKAIGVRKTVIQLSYHHTFEINMRKWSFDNKLQNARELRETMLRNTKTPLVFYLEPKEGFRIREDQGVNRYRIDVSVTRR